MKRLTFAAISIAMLLTALLGARAWLTAASEKPFTINTAAVSTGDVIDEVNATGALQAVTTVQVGTEVGGIIAWLGADYNSVVRKGQVVARLDSRMMEVELIRSRADITKAKAEAENAGQKLKDAKLKQDRMLVLWDKRLISRNDFEAAELAVSLAEQQERAAAASISQAEAGIKQDEVTLARAVITSPIDGIVIQRNVDVGQTVSTSTSAPTIFTIAADLKQMQVKAGIDESDISRVKPGQHVTFGVDAYPGVTFEGTVRQVRLEPTVTQNVITYSVIIDAPNPELKLLPGMTANVGIQNAARYDVLRVPNAALRFRPTPAMYQALGQVPDDRLPADDGEGEGSIDYNATVWVYANGKLVSVPVQTGVSSGQVTELVAGDLTPGALVVTGVVVGATPSATAAPSSNPFMMPGAGGGRGFRG